MTVFEGLIAILAVGAVGITTIIIVYRWLMGGRGNDHV